MKSLKILTLLGPFFTVVEEFGEVGQALLRAIVRNSEQRCYGGQGVALFVRDIWYGTPKRGTFFRCPVGSGSVGALEQPLHSFPVRC